MKNRDIFYISFGSACMGFGAGMFWTIIIDGSLNIGLAICGGLLCLFGVYMTNKSKSFMEFNEKSPQTVTFTQRKKVLP